MIALKRPPTRLTTVSLVPLIDVFMILLVFFLVTSTYLDLDALPATDPGRDQDADRANGQVGTGAPSTLVLRLRGDGGIVLRGEVVAPNDLQGALQTWHAERPDGSVVVIPSAQARMQGLADVMDALRAAGIARVRLVRLAADR